MSLLLMLYVCKLLMIAVCVSCIYSRRVSAVFVRRMYTQYTQADILIIKYYQYCPPLVLNGYPLI